MMIIAAISRATLRVRPSVSADAHMRGLRILTEIFVCHTEQTPVVYFG